MSEKIPPPFPRGLDPELVEQVSGGIDVCSPDVLQKYINDLRSNYDQLVDFTSYVIDRINGGPYNGP